MTTDGSPSRRERRAAAPAPRPTRRDRRAAAAPPAAPPPPRWLPLAVPGLAALVSLGWVGVALAGGAGRMDSAGASAAAGLAVLAASVVPPAGLAVRSVLVAGFPAATVAVAAAASGRSAVPLTAGCGVVVAVMFLAAWRAADRAGLVLATVAGAGIAALAAGLAHGPDGVGAVALVTAGAVLTLAAATESARERRPLALLVVPALVIGSPFAGGWSWWTVAVVGLVGAASGLVRTPLALSLLALAAAAVPEARPAAYLLASAGVIAAAVDRREAAALALPGGVALAIAVTTAPPSLANSTLAVAAGLTAAALAVAAARFRDGAHFLVVQQPGRTASRLPAVGVGIWLMVSPGSWGWVGETGLDRYDEGAARAAALAGLVVVVAWLSVAVEGSHGIVGRVVNSLTARRNLVPDLRQAAPAAAQEPGPATGRPR